MYIYVDSSNRVINSFETFVKYFYILIHGDSMFYLQLINYYLYCYGQQINKFWFPCQVVNKT